MAQAADAAAVASFELEFRDGHDNLERIRLGDAVSYPFWKVSPVRRFPASQRQRNLHVFEVFSKTSKLVRCESLLESHAVLISDFDPDVKDLASQPFRLYASFEDRSRMRHVPDLFELLADGRRRVVDVTLASKRDLPERKALFAVTQQLCEAAGWEYEVRQELPPAVLANIRDLSAFRREPMHLDRYRGPLLRAFLVPQSLVAANEVGPPALVRPVLFHLLWRRELAVDLTQPLTQDSMVAIGRVA